MNQCTVVISGVDSEKHIIGYVVPQGRFDREGLLEHLRFLLPSYMVPRILIEMKNLPLTPNGKVDKKALPPSDQELSMNREYVAPRNSSEEKLVAIWQRVFPNEKIGIRDNFSTSVVTLCLL